MIYESWIILPQKIFWPKTCSTLSWVDLDTFQPCRLNPLGGVSQLTRRMFHKNPLSGKGSTYPFGEKIFLFYETEHLWRWLLRGKGQLSPSGKGFYTELTPSPKRCQETSLRGKGPTFRISFPRKILRIPLPWKAELTPSPKEVFLWNTLQVCDTLCKWPYNHGMSLLDEDPKISWSN